MATMEFVDLPFGSRDCVDATRRWSTCCRSAWTCRSFVMWWAGGGRQLHQLSRQKHKQHRGCGRLVANQVQQLHRHPPWQVMVEQQLSIPLYTSAPMERYAMVRCSDVKQWLLCLLINISSLGLKGDYLRKQCPPLGIDCSYGNCTWWACKKSVCLSLISDGTIQITTTLFDLILLVVT